jgi:hypothetical protein
MTGFAAAGVGVVAVVHAAVPFTEARSCSARPSHGLRWH